MKDAVVSILFGLGVFVLVFVIAPRVNARKRDPRTGFEKLFDSPAGQLFVGALLLVLAAAIGLTAIFE